MYQINFAALVLFVALFFAGCSTPKIVNYGGGIFGAKPNSTYQNSSGTHLQAVHRNTFRPYNVFNVRYCPHTVEIGDTMQGIASWYGPDFHGKKTSSGETYNKYDLTAAHKTWPMHTVVRVDNLENGKSVIVRINDRGPFLKDRVIDLSYAAAKKIAMDKKGLASVRVSVLKTDDKNWPHNAPSGVSTGATKSECFDDRTIKAKKEVVAAAPSTPDVFLVQIASFSSFESAVRFQQTSLDLPLTLGSKIQEGNGLYRVLVGGFKNEAEARQFIANSKQDGAFLVREKR